MFGGCRREIRKNWAFKEGTFDSPDGPLTYNNMCRFWEFAGAVVENQLIPGDSADLDRMATAHQAFH